MMNQPSRSHLRTSDQLALKEFLNRLKNRFGDQVEQVWLFGSKARGDADAESDIDLLVVVRRADWALQKAIVELAFQVDIDRGTILSPHVVDRRRFAQMRAWQEPLYTNMVTEGTDLWTLEPAATT